MWPGQHRRKHRVRWKPCMGQGGSVRLDRMFGACKVLNVRALAKRHSTGQTGRGGWHR